MRSSSVFALIAASALSGCANFSSVHHSLDTSKGQGVLIDIKQRAILATTTLNNKAKPEDGTHSIVCAEPSPDALSAYAIDLAAGGNLPSGNSLNGGLRTAESSAFVGLRTQSIQLLRDQFFRACEAYLNGAASAGEYNFLIRRYQKQTAALLAIEQLTSMISAPAAAVSAGKETNFLFFRTRFEKNDIKIDELKKGLAVTGLAEETKKTLNSDLAKVEKENSDIFQILKSMEPQQPAANVVVPAKGDPPGGSKSKEDLAAVANVVGRIVDGVILTDDFLQLCMIRYGAIFVPDNPADDKWEAEAKEPSRPISNPPRTIHEACMTRMMIENDKFTTINGAMKDYVRNVLGNSSLTLQQKQQALSILDAHGTNFGRASD